MKMNARDVLRAIFRRIIGIYFRDIEVVGQVPAPGTGGRLFAANHVNALVDPILVLTSAPCDISPLAKSTLWNIPGLRWLLDAANAVPIVRRRDDPNKDAAKNDAIFERVAKHLGSGGNVLIFPEGTSHNEPHLLALKTGAGRMLARARADGAKELTYQSVALEFDARDVFRSRALVLYGPVRRVDDLGAEGDELVKRITDGLRDDLKELLVEGDTWDERLLIARVAEIFANESGDRSLAGVNAIGRRVEEAKRALDREDASLHARIADEVARYYALLEDAGVSDVHIARGAEVDPGRVLRAVALVLALPLALVGMVLYFVPYQIPRLTVRLGLGDRGADTASTLKLGAGLVAHPSFAAVFCGLAWWKLSSALAAAATGVVIAAPFAALAWLDRAARLRARLRVLAPGSTAALLARAREQRAALVSLLTQARAKVEPAA
jgi:1-acyl-sn-glycerol-3-phosphate acyltransferase